MEENLSKIDKLWIKLMQYGRNLGCHQKCERSFFINNYQFPVCARCTGVLLGYILSPLLLIITQYRLYISVILCTIMFIDWFMQYLKIKESTNTRRLITGIMGGIGIMNIFYILITNFF